GNAVILRPDNRTVVAIAVSRHQRQKSEGPRRGKPLEGRLLMGLASANGCHHCTVAVVPGAQREAALLANQGIGAICRHQQRRSQTAAIIKLKYPPGIRRRTNSLNTFSNHFY